MSKEQAVKFLDDYKKDRELMEKVEKIFSDNEEKSEKDIWIQVASESGYSFTPEELDEAFQQRTNQSGAIKGKLLDSNELAAVSGGEEDYCPNTYSIHHPDECKDTFMDRENCWHNDGCDNCYHIYPDYQCKRCGECKYAFSHR